MILKCDQITMLLEQAPQSDDPLVITPQPDLGALRRGGSASLDLRLGTWLASMRNRRVSLLDVYSKDTPPPSETRLVSSLYVPFGQRYVLHPRTFVLGITLEWIRLPTDLAGYVIGKSSWGRRGLIIATATGVHPGFTGCLTLEISNLGEVPIVIKAGMLICQLFLHQVLTETKSTDRTSFMGQRKPTLGTISPDPIADKLGSYKGFGDSLPIEKPQPLE